MNAGVLIYEGSIYMYKSFQEILCLFVCSAEAGLSLEHAS